MKSSCFIVLIVSIVFANKFLIAQGVAINNDNSNPDPSAMLDVKSTAKFFSTW
jgi:hypothetical protein